MHVYGHMADPPPIGSCRQKTWPFKWPFRHQKGDTDYHVIHRGRREWEGGQQEKERKIKKEKLQIGMYYAGQIKFDLSVANQITYDITIRVTLHFFKFTSCIGKNGLLHYNKAIGKVSSKLANVKY